MNADEIITRLRALPSSPFAVVDGAAALAAIADAPLAMPAAYVALVDERSEPNRYFGNAVGQQTGCQLAVIIYTRNVSDHIGAAAASEIGALKRAVRRGLVGWKPASAEMITHVAGELVRARGGVVVWQETFETTYELTESL